MHLNQSVCCREDDRAQNTLKTKHSEDGTLNLPRVEFASPVNHFWERKKSEKLE